MKRLTNIVTTIYLIRVSNGLAPSCKYVRTHGSPDLRTDATVDTES
jgi:hypothetical protein